MAKLWRRVRRTARWVRREWPYVALFLFLILPLWVMAASLAIRSGLFGFGDVSPDQKTVFLTFVAGGLGTAATVLGALLTREHNARERWRQQLEAVVAGLKLVREEQPPSVEKTLHTSERSLPVKPNGSPAAAGAFSSMVLLGHRHAALRVLDPAWESGQVDAATATWVIGQVLAGEDESLEGRTVSPDAMLEAAVILKLHAKRGDLVDPAENETYFFPGHFMRAWTTDTKMPTRAKLDLLSAMVEIVCSKDLAWCNRKGWPQPIWKECARKEPERVVRYAARDLLRAAGFDSPSRGWRLYAFLDWMFKSRSECKECPPERVVLMLNQVQSWKEKQDIG